MLEATYERSPPHYHVALFPEQYESYVQDLRSATMTAATKREYRVQRGDSLWSIAKRHGTSIAELRAANDLTTSRIYAGQVLTVPAGR